MSAFELLWNLDQESKINNLIDIVEKQDEKILELQNNVEMLSKWILFLLPKPYNPYEIGKDLYKNGHGISSIWGAVQSDSDMDECHRGYNDSQKEAQSNNDSARGSST